MAEAMLLRQLLPADVASAARVGTLDGLQQAKLYT